MHRIRAASPDKHLVLYSIFRQAAQHVGSAVLDVRDPTQPAIVGVFDTPGFAFAVSVSGTTAYVADEEGGFLTIPLPQEIVPITIPSASEISFTIPSPMLAGHYTLRVFNHAGSFELPGIV